MVSGVRFMAASGAHGNTIASLYANGQATPRFEIFNLEPGATNNPNRMGFFGAGGAPNSAIIVGQYQDRTHRTNETGSDLGQMINVKFTGASTASVSGVAFTAGLQSIPQASGTLLCRFTEPNNTAVVTQSATFAAIDLNAASGAPNVNDLVTGVTVKAAQLPDTQGFAGSTAWQNIDDGGSALSLSDQSSAQAVHDFHLIVSSSPQSAGRKTNWGFVVVLQFL